MRQIFKCLSCGGQYFDRSIDGGTYHHVCPPLPPDRKGRVRVRENPRDENIAVDRQYAAIGIKAEGAGVKCLSDEKIAEPEWITRMYQRITDIGEEQARGEFKRA